MVYQIYMISNYLQKWKSGYGIGDCERVYAGNGDITDTIQSIKADDVIKFEIDFSNMNNKTIKYFINNKKINYQSKLPNDSCHKEWYFCVSLYYMSTKYTVSFP